MRKMNWLITDEVIRKIGLDTHTNLQKLLCMKVNNVISEGVLFSNQVLCEDT